jgi:nitrogen fixation-related uncharacterized protein
MQFKPSIWFPIALILAAANLIAVPVYAADPWHSFAHGAVGVAFALWAQRLKQRRDRDREAQQSLETPAGDRLEGVEDELTRLRHELSETQERLDFTERMLAQRKQDPQREPRP